MDIAAQRASLDAIYGPTSGDLEVELWIGHVDAGGVEVSGDGYAPGDLPASLWLPADSDGVKSITGFVECGTTPGDAWSGTVTHYVLRDGGGVSWGCFPLPVSDRLTVGDAGTEPVKIQPRVFFGQRDDN